MKPSRVLLIVLILALVPAMWFAEYRLNAQAPVSCDDQYNALVQQAKAELAKGDRTGAINSLIEARNKLRDCETPASKDVIPMWRN